MRNGRLIVAAFAIAIAVASTIAALPIGGVAATGRPGSPTSITLRTGPDYVDVSWEPPAFDGGSPVTAYLVYIVPPGLQWVGSYPDTAPPVATLPADARSFRHAGLVPGDSYTYYMKAQNANGLSEWAGWEWAVPGKSAPGAPDLSIRIGNGVAWLHYQLADQGGTKTLGCKVYRGTGAGSTSLLENVSLPYGVYSGSYEDVGLANDQTYFYRVSFYNIMGEGAASLPVAALPRASPVSVTAYPGGVDNCGPVDIQLNWSLPEGASRNITGFRAYCNERPLSGTIAPENRTYTAHVSGGWGYRFQVSAVYDDGTESYSGLVYVSSPMCEGAAYDPTPLLLFIALIGAFLAAFLVVWGLRRARR